MFKRKIREPALTEKLDTLEHALASGVKVKDALQQAGLTPRQYGLAMFLANPVHRAPFDPHAVKTQGVLD